MHVSHLLFVFITFVFENVGSNFHKVGTSCEVSMSDAGLRERVAGVDEDDRLVTTTDEKMTEKQVSEMNFNSIHCVLQMSYMDASLL